MTLSRHHWLIALFVALLLHLSLLVVVLAADNADGARDEGEQGIEIDLGMLGDLGQAEDTREETVVETVVKAPSEPEPEVPPPEPEPVKAPEPVVEAPPPPPEIQTPVVEAKRELPKPQPKRQPQKPEPAPEPVTAPTQAETASRNAKAADRAQQAQQKLSTGRADAMTQGGNAAVRQSWYARLAAELARHKRYPLSARRRGQEGIAKISFLVNRKGEVLEYTISESSGYKLLDQAVIDMLMKAKPLPAFPAEMKQDEIRITLPVEFSLQS
ncbi:energy transducer TonB [Marinobacterium sp. D7]|uniref:energy transducer TonB n=1 Tax=Marinobacterium ramblicola TaxID=2849041 RepID=UPI001C2D07FA|nr:energy transducer TonB [Marinobacterium ramblicola]MBV1789622.1 energy transducer TonB [Marinobacterium ramblicola]